MVFNSVLNTVQHIKSTIDRGWEYPTVFNTVLNTVQHISEGLENHDILREIVRVDYPLNILISIG